MAGRDDRLPPSDHAAVPVPQLIEKYRIQREAWMAQAEELARLRDEVRGSAEREAMEIVTAARRDIRQIVMEARRELFVLSAQVQAALGEGSPGSPQLGPPAIAHDDDRGGLDEDLTAFAQEEWGFAPRSTVAAVLEEARHDIEVLDKDARAVPSAAPVAPPAAETSAEELPAPPPAAPTPDLNLLSHSLAVEARDTSFRFVAVFALIAILVVGGAAWLLWGRSGDAGATVPVEAPAAAPSAPSAAPSEAAASRPPASVTLSIEAVRPSWIRAVVDGRPDETGQMLRAGQRYEFTGRTIALRVGDAGAVRVSVNGGEAQTLGRDGQVVNRQYTVDAPAPAPAPPTPAAPADQGSVPDAPDNPGAAATSSRPEDPLPEASALRPSLEPLEAPNPPEAVTDGLTTSPAPSPAVEGAASAGPPRELVLAAAQQWLDAYHREDQAMLAVLSTPDVVIADERPTGERMPAAAGAIARTLERVNVQLAADTAVLTGVMTERALAGGLQRSSPVSLVWVSMAGSWRLSQARLVSQSTLGQIFR